MSEESACGFVHGAGPERNKCDHIVSIANKPCNSININTANNIDINDLIVTVTINQTNNIFIKQLWRGP